MLKALDQKQMRYPTTPATFRMALAIIVTLGLFFASGRVSPGSDSVSSGLLHAQQIASDSDHSHSYDDEVTVAVDQSPQHSHQHDPSDHSHDTPCLPPLAFSAARLGLGLTPTVVLPAALSRIADPWHRPPRASGASSRPSLTT